MPASQIPTPSAPLVTPETGRITVPWFQFFLRLLSASGSFAPADGQYIVTAPDADLPNARVATDSATIDVDLTVPGIIRWHTIGGAGSWVPLALGVEPLTFVSDGAGSPIFVWWTPDV